MNTSIHLSKRENQIAELLSWGADKKQIADRLFVSVKTVDNHCQHIFEKLDINKCTELSAWWFCTHFGISFDLSPMIRRTIAMCLLCLFTYGELTEHIDIFRRGRGRSRTEELRETARRNRRTDEEADYFIYDFEPIES